MSRFDAKPSGGGGGRLVEVLSTTGGTYRPAVDVRVISASVELESNEMICEMMFCWRPPTRLGASFRWETGAGSACPEASQGHAMEKG